MMGDGRTYIGQKKATGSYADAMLHVDGKIACRSLYVLKPVSWADEVFEENYKLMDLIELRNYIKKHKHLPEIPSEEEIKEKGYDQHELNRLLLKKIEELTLYIIQLENKKNGN
ncbi:MAG: hypothetical protein QXE07_03205 [Thermoplasmata archaeon]